MGGQHLSEEAAALQEKINVSIREAQQKALARRQEETLLLLTAAHEKCIRCKLVAEFSLTDDVAELLKTSGEEDLVEEDCVKRYTLFLEKKATNFCELAHQLKAVVDLLPGEKSGSKRGAAAENGIGGGCSPYKKPYDGGLLELRHLWQLTELLDRRSAPAVVMSCIQELSDEDEQVYAEDRQLDFGEIRVREALAEQKKLLSDSKARVKAAEDMHAALKAECKSACESEIVVLKESSFSEDDVSINGAQCALDALQAATQGWIRQRKELENTRSVLQEKLSEVIRHTEACKQSRTSFLSNMKEMEQSTAQLKKTYAELSLQLKRRERQCLDQEQVLADREANYAALRNQVEHLTDLKGTGAAELNGAEYERRQLCTDVEELRGQVVSLQRNSDQTTMTLEAALVVEKRIQEEVQYLAGLIPDQRSVNVILTTAADESTRTEAPSSMYEYLHFFQKARNLRRKAPMAE